MPLCFLVPALSSDFLSPGSRAHHKTYCPHPTLGSSIYPSPQRFIICGSLSTPLLSSWFSLNLTKDWNWFFQSCGLSLNQIKRTTMTGTIALCIWCSGNWNLCSWNRPNNENESNSLVLLNRTDARCPESSLSSLVRFPKKHSLRQGYLDSCSSGSLRTRFQEVPARASGGGEQGSVHILMTLGTLQHRYLLFDDLPSLTQKWAEHPGPSNQSPIHFRSPGSSGRGKIS